MFIVEDQFKSKIFCYPLEGPGAVKNNMGRVAFIIPVCKSFVVRRVKPGHDRENSSRCYFADNASDFFGRVSEMLKGFCGNDKVIKFIQACVREKVRVVSIGFNSLSLKQGFQDRLIATSIIQRRFNFVVLENIDFLLKHLHITFALKAVFMFQIAFDFFVSGNMKLFGYGYRPAFWAEPVFPVLSGDQVMG